MKKRNLLIMIMLIGVVLIVTESFIVHDQYQEKLKKKNEMREEERNIDIRRCYKNLCTDSLSISQDKGDYYLQFKIKNEGKIQNEEGILEVQIEKGIKRKFYCSKLNENE